MSLFTRVESDALQTQQQITALQAETKQFDESTPNYDHLHPLYTRTLALSKKIDDIHQHMLKFESKADEKDPEKRVWGQKQCEKAKTLVNNWKPHYEEFTALKQRITDLYARSKEEHEREFAAKQAAEREQAEKAAKEAEEKQKHEENLKKQAEEARQQEELRKKQELEALEAERVHQSELKRKREAEEAAERARQEKELAEQKERELREAEDKKKMDEKKAQMDALNAKKAELARLPPQQRVKEEIKLHLQFLRQSCKDNNEYLVALQTVGKFISNIHGNPHNAEFRKINVGNAILQTRLTNKQGAMELLDVLGFKKQPNNDTELLLTPSAELWNVLVEAKAVVENELKDCVQPSAAQPTVNIATNNANPGAATSGPTSNPAPAAQPLNPMAMFGNMFGGANPMNPMNPMGGAGGGTGMPAMPPLGNMAAMFNDPFVQSVMSNPRFMQQAMSASPSMGGSPENMNPMEILSILTEEMSRNPQFLTQMMTSPMVRQAVAGMGGLGAVAGMPGMQAAPGADAGAGTGMPAANPFASMLNPQMMQQFMQMMNPQQANTANAANTNAATSTSSTSTAQQPSSGTTNAQNTTSTNPASSSGGSSEEVELSEEELLAQAMQMSMQKPDDESNNNQNNDKK